MHVFLAAGGSPGAEVLLEAFQRAARAWHEAAPFGEYRLERTDRPDAADVVMAWSDAELPVETGACRPTVEGAGVTTFCRSRGRPDRLHAFPLRGGSGRDASPVRMIVLLRRELAADGARAARVAAHELGHVLGIARHSPDSDDLMWAGRLGVRWPSPADRSTVQLLYHTPPDLVP